VFEATQRLARRTRKSRSRIFSEALKEYVARHEPDQVTEAMDRICAELGVQEDAFVASASRRVLQRTDW
jgi:predicted transcriptional regulator